MPVPEPSRKPFPFPPWLLALDLLATLVLAGGIWLLASPAQATRWGVPARAAWACILVGAVVALACCAALVRYARTTLARR